MFAFSEPLFSQIPSHIDSVRSSLYAITQEEALASEIAQASVPGAFNPYLGKRLEGMAPPRPALDALGQEETVALLEKLLSGLESGLRLHEADEWLSIEVSRTCLKSIFFACVAELPSSTGSFPETVPLC